ncbi:hypothetical protein GCM10009735_75040 [Actinomadura chokoriensis]
MNDPVTAEVVGAVGSTLPGASWQRCRTHYLRNLLTRVPKSAQSWVATLVRTMFDQPAAEEVHAQHARVVASLAAKHPDAAGHLDEARPDLLAFTCFPRQIWRQIWSNNPQERLNKEIRRRTDVVGIFPDRAAIVRLVGAVLMEQTDEWAEARRYMGLECLAKARLRVIEDTTPDPLPSSRNSPLNLQKQDHAKINSYTIPLDATPRRSPRPSPVSRSWLSLCRPLFRNAGTAKSGPILLAGRDRCRPPRCASCWNQASGTWAPTLPGGSGKTADRSGVLRIA